MSEGSGGPPKKDPFAPLPLDPSLGSKPTPRADRPDPFAPLPLDPAVSPSGRTAVPDEAAPSVSAAWDAPPAPDLFSDFEATPTPTPQPEAPPAGLAVADTPTPTPMPPVASAPSVLPAYGPTSSSSADDELRAAVGAPPRVDSDKKARRTSPPPIEDDEDLGSGDGGPPRRRNRLLVAVGAATLVLGGGIAAMIIVGKINSERYLIACAPDRVVVQQGRAFPPWGETTLDGAEWKALPIPPEAPCAPRETTNKGELAQWYVKILVDHATGLLTAREVTKVDDAEAHLKQALLVTRSLAYDDDRKNVREDIERLLGDVGYWRASARLRDAADTLSEAAKQFDLAAAARPRHVTDAAAWAKHVRTLADQLRAGPGGVPSTTFPPLPPTERPTAPPGVALPVEPGAGAGSAEPSTDVASEPAPPAPPDAGLPTGGVLL